MSLHHTLSRLLSGELSAEEEAAVRAQIAADPAARDAWEAMQRLPDDIADLPDISPPPALNAALAAPRRPWGVALGVLSLAALALLFLRPMVLQAPPPDLVVVSGQQWVHGEALLLVDGHRVAVDGKVLITVEPPPGAVRETGHPTPEGPMNTTAILAAAAGSAITVAVYEGSAILSPTAPDAPPVVLTAGQSHTTAPTPRTPTTSLSEQRAETAATIARLEDALEEARQEQEQLALENAINRGQLKAVQGEYADWPADVPEQFTESWLTEHISAQLEDFEDAELMRTDCDEYPCMVVIRSHDPELTWGDSLGQQLAPLMEGYDEESTAVTINRSAFTHDDHESRFMVIAASDKATTTDDVAARLDYRMDELIDELGEMVAEEAEGQGE